MTQVSPESVLRLAPGCRLNQHGSQQDLLLIPEGAMRMQGPARKIVELLNGERTVRARSSMSCNTAMARRMPRESKPKRWRCSPDCAIEGFLKTV